MERIMETVQEVVMKNIARTGKRPKQITMGAAMYEGFCIEASDQLGLGIPFGVSVFMGVPIDRETREGWWK